MTSGPTTVALTRGTQPLEITDEFQTALTLMEQSGRSVFVTGRAGTGKSTLLHHFKSTTKRKHVTLAPTGIAALRVGGQTLHSFFGFPHHFLEPTQVKKAKRYRKVIEKLECLIIDEVSMVRADVFDAVDRALRITRNNPAPFGGVQVLLFGDVFQLPPVVERGLESVFAERFPGPFFFDSDAWQKLNPVGLELTKVFRQVSDPRFVDLLNRVRNGSTTSADLAALNDRIRPASDTAGHPLVLTATNAIARDINTARLNAIRGPAQTYAARVEGDFEESSYPTDEHLALKQGAQVLMVRNDPEKKWVNGDVGEVTYLGTDHVRVRIGDETHDVRPVVWEKHVYRLDDKSKEITPSVVGTFEQMPLKLAWAITIHKSQGQTYENVAVDLGTGAFAHGQTYVALSRCRRLDGLTLRRPLRARDILCHPRVHEFHRRWVGVFRNGAPGNLS
ncbi:MAG: AAA family ATPase [Elusimicrobia bacterium]|nr:AAA family ATPase [Elusimicrobiota bacterium]MBP9698705.1 AAA family ATPase [Elusimicrobiota bacterium]